MSYLNLKFKLSWIECIHKWNRNLQALQFFCHPVTLFMVCLTWIRGWFFLPKMSTQFKSVVSFTSFFGDFVIRPTTWIVDVVVLSGGVVFTLKVKTYTEMIWQMYIWQKHVLQLMHTGPTLVCLLLNFIDAPACPVANLSVLWQV